MPHLVWQEVAQDPQLAGIPQLWGAHELERQESAPRVVWVATEEANEGPEVGDYEVPILLPAPRLIPGATVDGGVQYLPRKPGARVAHAFNGPGQNQSVVAAGLDLVVNLATDALGVITSTAASVAAAVLGSPLAAQLVLPQPQGTGLGRVKASPRTKLRSYATRVSGVDLHLFTADWGSMCARPGGLINTMRLALRRAAQGALRIGTARWSGETQGQHGIAYVLPVEFLIPVLEELPAAQVQTQAVTPPAEV